MFESSRRIPITVSDTTRVLMYLFPEKKIRKSESSETSKIAIPNILGILTIIVFPRSPSIQNYVHVCRYGTIAPPPSPPLNAAPVKATKVRAHNLVVLL